MGTRMKKDTQFEVDTIKRPNVLLLGNGMLKLGTGAQSWEKLLKSIKMRKGDFNVNGIPMVMQPEVFCGVQVEDIQRRVAETIKTADSTHPLLQELLMLPFDAFLTTNYTYEIEEILTGKPFTSYDRKKAFTALDGNSAANHNTFICNSIRTTDGRQIPVFHIHGEKERKKSLVLSYYSYAKSTSLLTKYNRDLKNNLYECQQEEKAYKCKSWLDYFLIGNVWSVGFGLDVSEFDLWWAIERKARENAQHGYFKAFITEPKEKANAQKELLEAMDCKYVFYPPKNSGYEGSYRQIIDDIKKDLRGSV